MSGRHTRVTEAAVTEWLRKMGGRREAALRREKAAKVTPKQPERDKRASRDT